MCHRIGQHLISIAQQQKKLNVIYYNSSHGIMNMKKHIANKHDVILY
jgi:hypothetical protein